MSHQQLALERAVHPAEDLGDGVFAFSPFPEHILLTWGICQVDASYSRTLLAAVVLLLHHQVELVKAIPAGTVFVLVVSERLEKADHRHAAFVFELISHFPRMLL